MKTKRIAYVMEVSSGNIVMVREGESGYHTVIPPIDQARADEVNDGMNVDPGMAESMLVGSMFGWNVPGANPEKYNWEL